MHSPYSALPPRSFWRSGVGESDPRTIEDFYRKKFDLAATDKIATAGSCFAQHVSNYMRKRGFSILDMEPQPEALSKETAKQFGYGIYSARYGNIYTVRQLLQLAHDALSGTVDAGNVWEKDGRYFDALRPAVEPEGLDSVEETLILRAHHLSKVKRLFEQMDVFVFTLGLTEAWIDRRNGRVYPTAPGTIAGAFDPEIHEFRNFDFAEIHRDFLEFHALVKAINPGVRMILTVSPVPLTATATDDHVLVATTYSKSVLRAVAGSLVKSHPDIDYFPSYEIIASPWTKGEFYEENLRSVRAEGVATVMRIFFSQHGTGEAETQSAGDEQAAKKLRKLPRAKDKRDEIKSQDDVVCEDVLLEAFAP